MKVEWFDHQTESSFTTPRSRWENQSIMGENKRKTSTINS